MSAPGRALIINAEACTLMCHPGDTPEAVSSGYARQREVKPTDFRVISESFP